MATKKTLVVLCVTALVTTISALVIYADNKVPADIAAVRDVLGYDEIEGGKWNPTPDRALTLLQWDDGSFETGLGVAGGAGYDGQVGMRFGGGAATMALIPMQIRGAYWRFYPGFGGATQVNINFWHPLGATPPRFPTGAAPLLQVAGNTNTTATQFVSVAATAGPTISTPNGSVLVGVGVLGTSSWYLAADNNSSPASRQYFGAGTNSTLAWNYGGATLSGYGFAINYLARLYVDGNVPVELQKLSVE
jgi:hypothetical protein